MVYADDTTVNVAAPSNDELVLKLESMFKTVSDYMVSQGLKLNDDKSHLLHFKNTKSRTETEREVVLGTTIGVIKPSEKEKFLGGIVQQDLKWTGHVINDKEQC